jgi:hypothetical protein
VRATYKNLVADLKKSKCAIATYSAELSEKEICKIRPSENQYSKMDFEICDNYWPYERATHSETREPDSYVTAVKNIYLSLGCTKAKFSPVDARKNREFERQGVPLEIIEDAMLMGGCRKYPSWLEGRDSEPIGNLVYFENLVAEIERQPFPLGYTEYLREKNTKLAEAWAEKTPSGSQPRQEK